MHVHVGTTGSNAYPKKACIVFIRLASLALDIPWRCMVDISNERYSALVNVI